MNLFKLLKAKSIHLALLFISLHLTVCWACSDEDNQVAETPQLAVSTSSLNFEEEAESKELSVICNTEWTCSVQEGSDWCRIEQQEDRVTVSVDENEDKNVRRAMLCFAAASLTDTVQVAQLGWGKAILLSSENVSVQATGETVEVEVTTNVEFTCEIDEDCDWVSIPSTKSSDHPVTTTTFHLSVAPNTEDADRQATVQFKDQDEQSELEAATLVITQQGIGEYEAVDLDEIKDDLPITITSATASSAQPGEGIERSFDGDKTTLYHSNYDNTTEGYFPITLEYHFDAGSDMDYLVYYPRSDGGTNGNFKEVDIEVLHNANSRQTEEWEYVMTYDFNGSTSARRVDFPQSLIGVSAIRLTVKSGVGSTPGFVSCAEMEFYKKNPENFDYTQLFTDPSCSELKPGITEQDILACDHSFFKNIAYYMYHDRYEREFRIASYKAYPHPDTQAATNKTSPYSLLDNPTGISIAKGETMVVMVGELQGYSLSVRIQNLDAPGADGFGGTEYPLAEGINKFVAEEKGLAYLMYHTSDYELAPPVTVHFATGTVNGYYDSQNPDHDNRQSELLANATDEYFDVVGKYAHLTFPTARFRNHTGDLKALIDTYDDIAYHEQLLMGLEKYGKMFRNRMYLHVIYTSYMYATSYHTAYNDETLSQLCDEEQVRTTDSCWGPAHEIGHCNQTRPGLKWLGTTEVTNNIMSEYIQTTVFGLPSRLQVEELNDQESPNYYSRAWNDIIAGGIAHASESDVFCKLVPFWQLELYFGKVLGRTPLEQADKGGFYPDVYEYVRTHADLGTAGEQQLEFVYIASLAAQADLTDFFEKWGFLTPVDTEIDDYGTGQFTVTQSQIDEIKSRVAALGYPAPAVALEYITDNNYETFQTQASVVSGTASRNGDQLSLDDWKNAVAFEVREADADGTLICVTDAQRTEGSVTFSVKGGWKDTYKVYAVGYDNSRTEVDFE